jgi:hypothetical protein
VTCHRRWFLVGDPVPSRPARSSVPKSTLVDQ